MYHDILNLFILQRFKTEIYSVTPTNRKIVALISNAYASYNENKSIIPKGILKDIVKGVSVKIYNYFLN